MARLINTYCRSHELIFVEMGSRGGQPGLWFIDGEQRLRWVSEREVLALAPAPRAN